MVQHVTKLSGTILHCAGFAQPRRGVGQDAQNKVGHRRGIIKSERPPVFGWPFCFGVPVMKYFCMVQHVTKTSGTFLHCAGFAQTRRA